MAELRVDALAEAAGVTVDVVRSYQSKGLLPPPRHQGRVALYGPRHLERLRTIRELKGRGHSLKVIAAMLAEQPAGGRRPRTAARDGDEERLTLAEVAERSRVPPALLRSLEASGLLRPVRVGDSSHYTLDDVRAVRMVLSLVGAGVPLEDFLRVAKTQIEAATTVVEEAVELFLRHVREPLLDAGLPPEEEAARLVNAFRGMLHAANGLIAYNVQRMMLNLVEERLERSGTGAELKALQRQVAALRLDAEVGM